MPSLTQLEYAVAVDTHRHFGRAARSCFVSQPTLSMQLHKMEEELGVVIFDRSKQPIIPTPKGADILLKARLIISEVRKLEQLSRQSGLEPSGKYRLGIIPTLAPYLLPLFLQKFSVKYPKIDLYVSEMKTADILSALELDKIDAGILATPFEGSNITEKVLFYEPFYFFVNPNHPQFNKAKVHAEDLNDNQIWLLEEGHCFRNQVLQLCASSKRKTVLPNVHFESGNLETLKELVVNGSGFTLLPYLSIWKETNTKIKQMLKPFHKPIPCREISLVTSRDQINLDITNALFNTIEGSVPKVLPRSSKNLDVLEITLD